MKTGIYNEIRDIKLEMSGISPKLSTYKKLEERLLYLKSLVGGQNMEARPDNDTAKIWKKGKQIKTYRSIHQKV